MMKRFVVTAVLAMVLASGAQAQDGMAPMDPAMNNQGMVAPAMPAAEDPAVEMLFWDSIKDSDNPDMFLAYMQRYPNGVFRVIAEAKIKEIYSGGAADAAGDVAVDEGEEEDVAAEPDPAPQTVIIQNRPAQATGARATTIRSIQRQLARLGCYRGAIDGVWGPQSQRAARRFNQNTRGANISVTSPGPRAITILRSVRVRVCR